LMRTPVGALGGPGGSYGKGYALLAGASPMSPTVTAVTSVSSLMRNPPSFAFTARF
jgi:hypothetical protein